MSSTAAAALKVGDRCLVGSKRGVIRFLGDTKFAAGRWVGVELATAEGKNDGSVQGERYFACPPLHGLFVKVALVKPDPAAAAADGAEPTPSSTPSTTAPSASSLPAPESKTSHTRKTSTVPRPSHLVQPSSSRADDSKLPHSPSSPRSPRSPRTPTPATSKASTTPSSSVDRKREELFKLQENRQQLQQAKEGAPTRQPLTLHHPPPPPLPPSSTRSPATSTASWPPT